MGSVFSSKASSGEISTGEHLITPSSTQSSVATSSDSGKESINNVPDLPIADKRIKLETGKLLLKAASSKALSDLITADYVPDIRKLSSINFPFENAVFEGGGVKGIAYVGAIKCLEDVGVRIKRFAGSSIGATIAALAAVGYTSDELVTLYIQDLSLFIRDSRCELLCFLPRLISNLGMNPGRKFLDWYGKCLAVKTGNPDITFREVYDRFGTELCVVVLNMNTGREEYFHPKTTPNLSVRVAVRMSISVPGVLQPMHLLHSSGDLDLYIDGGVICNYPIYVFDGWWLSMEPCHQIYHKLQMAEGFNGKQSFFQLFDPQSRFLTRNCKTIGFKQTTHNDFFNDTKIAEPIVTQGTSPNKKNYQYSRPNTKLARKKIKKIIAQEASAEAKSMQLGALIRFFQVLQSSSDSAGYIIKDKLNEALIFKIGCHFKPEHFRQLFGDETSPNELLKSIPLQPDGVTVSPTDLDMHLRSFGLDMNRLLEAGLVLRQEMEGPRSFWARLQGNVTGAARRSFVKLEDLERTVNIHTDYISYLDFEISLSDKEFLLRQGYKSTLAFLVNWSAVNHNTAENCDSSDGVDLCGEDLPYIDEDISDRLCDLTPDNASL